MINELYEIHTAMSLLPLDTASYELGFVSLWNCMFVLPRELVLLQLISVFRQAGKVLFNIDGKLAAIKLDEGYYRNVRRVLRKASPSLK